MAFSRRNFLMGLGGAMVGLPFLEGLAPKTARADNTIPPFAIFHRQGNGVQQGMLFGKAEQEPERWWPAIPYGALGAIPTESAIRELAAYTDKLTIIRGLRHPMGTQLGHREGAVQGLTGAGIKYPSPTPDVFNCESMGESLDNRICRELTPGSPESLYMSLGDNTGQTPGGSLSFRNTITDGKAQSRTGEENLVALYNRIFLPGLSDVDAQKLLTSRRISVNDLVRTQLGALEKDPRLSQADRARLDLHMQSIRDIEVALTCTIPPDLQGQVASYQSLYASHDDTYRGDMATAAGTMMAKLAALAVRCGASRSVLVSMGPYQDGSEYDEVPGGAGQNFHQVSHRLLNEIPGAPTDAALLHHTIDRFHLQRFKSILDELAAVDTGDGKTLLDHGVCVHYSDQGAGQHETTMLPYLYVGSAGGALRTGLYQNYATASGPGIQPGSDGQYTVKLLNTIGAAVGVLNTSRSGPLDDLNATNNGGIKGRLDALVV